MAICATTVACDPPNTTDRSVRVLRWTFRRGDEAVVSELCLSRDNSAYELRLNLPWDLSGPITEVFDDAMPAFQRHAAVERMLVEEGWTLEGFESEQTTPAAS
jgi:hypothetical protein